jgi:pimeloyl-ACP methyl ester carboxylesterase
MEYLRIEKAHILGQSLSSAVAVDFALAYPEKTSSLIAVYTSGLLGYPWPEVLDKWFQPIYSEGQRGKLDLRDNPGIGGIPLF